ncbi:MAG: hypothetical protein ACTSXH_14490 [Promethearchaeota archaeon]
MGEKFKKIKRERSAAWAMINWGIIQDIIETKIGISPDQISIEEALESIEKENSEEKLFLFEAKTLEKLLIQRLTKILYKNRGKEIKKRKVMKEKSKVLNPRSRPGVQVLPMGSIDDLKKMGMDPKMIEQFSKSLMDQLFRKRKKKDKEDEDEDDEPGASFYM